MNKRKKKKWRQIENDYDKARLKGESKYDNKRKRVWQPLIFRILAALFCQLQKAE